MNTTTAAEYAELYGGINEHRNEHTREEATTMNTKAQKAIARDHAGHHLSGIVEEGATVYAIIDSVARSGMSRTMRLFVIRDNEPIFITREVATVLNNPMKNGSMRVSGGGMDMVFATVYELGQAMFDDGYALRHRQI